MSLPYLSAALETTVDAIRSHVSTTQLNHKNCDIQPEGKPFPSAPALYVGVDENGIQNPIEPEQDHLEERLRISVVISIRIGAVAPDRKNRLWFGALSSFSPLDRQIVNALHGNYSLVAKANQKLNPDEQNFLEGLWFTGQDKTRIESSAWSGELESNATGWHVRRLNFTGFRRIQRNGEIT